MSTPSTSRIYLGCAGWSLPREQWPAFPVEGTHLQRYAARFSGVEINSSFYRPHRPATYAKWADSVDRDFRFSVKVPKQITHERRLLDCAGLVDEFLGQCSQLGEKLGCLLIQLPPSLAFDEATAGAFFTALRDRYQGLVVLEPRHPSWLTPQALTLLQAECIGRVAADPSPLPGGDQPAGWPGIRYYRLHGSPRIYYSSYEEAWLERLARQLKADPDTPTWCIFDNTASGAATADALRLMALLDD
ncbi:MULTISPECIES: DUF72 domain-containing protein [Pseudomonas]|uniref:DUF72 domain-containing protein n=1 Tax=Pseudomonas TaxID=286 RepID=UPI001BEABD54|nr:MULTISPECIES: DUF72 domain-containing protein [Pseudomonas]MBT2337831.1 DUF72 domain-containing protein [Pseudomonas fluorescens]MCD4529282.1 DUF72 domain-containing protein [Pseudomonas sp. C3-2018]